MTAPLELPGLRVELDRLVYRQGGDDLPPGKPHAFIYFLTLHNASAHTVTFLGRKWIIEHPDGSQNVIEGDKIVGETPRLAPGEHFSYNSYHVVDRNSQATGAFFATTDEGRVVFAKIPDFEMQVPQWA